MMNPMCALVQRWMVRLEERELDPARSRCLGSHVGRCETCRAAWEAQLKVATLLRPDRETQSADFERLWDSVAPRLESRPGVSSRRPWMVPGAWAVAGAVSLAIFGWLQIDGNLVDNELGGDAVVAEAVSVNASVTRNPNNGRVDIAAKPNVLNSDLTVSPVRRVVTPRKAVAASSTSSELVRVRKPANSAGTRRLGSSVAAAVSSRMVVSSTQQPGPTADPAANVSSPSTNASLKTASWQDDFRSEMSPMDAVQQASVSRSLFH